MPRKRVYTGKQTYICQLCGKKVIKISGISMHLTHAHGYNKQTLGEYYTKYISTEKKHNGTCFTCGKPTRFRDMNRGFCPYCSEKCASIQRENDRKLLPPKPPKRKSIQGLDELDIVLFGKSVDLD